MSSKLITVIGATGNQGGSVIDVFLNKSGWKVRGITRDPSKPAGQKLKERGVEVVAADLDDVASLKTAFKGSNVIFAVTDFWQFMQNKALYGEAEKQGKSIRDLAYEGEVRHGKNVVDAAESTVSTLDRFVISTLGSSKELSKGAVTGNYHFDAKWEAAKYLQSTYPDLKAKTSYVQLAMFANVLQGPAISANDDGSFTLGLPIKSSRSVPIVVPEKDTGAFVEALVELPAGENVIAWGSHMTMPQLAEALTKHTGNKVSFYELPEGTLEKGMGVFGEELEPMFKYISDFGYDGAQPGLKQPNELGVPVKTTSIETWLGQQDWSGMGKKQ